MYHALRQNTQANMIAEAFVLLNAVQRNILGLMQLKPQRSVLAVSRRR
jgi:hypothetical protein